MAASPDGTRLFISNMDGKDVSILGWAELQAAGETCENAHDLVAPAFCVEGCTAGYRDDYNESCPFPAVGAPDRVYRYVAAVTDTLDIELCTSGFDTKFYIYSGDCGSYNSGDALYCNDDFCGVNGWRSRLEDVVFQSGQTYYLIIDGYGPADAGNFTLCFENDCPADLNNDEALTVADLILLLRGFGVQFQVGHLMEFISVFGGVCE
jgi:hypothetical protein